MPYWDFWTTDRVYEEEHGYVFQGAMGGNGDGDDWWTVTDDWPWSTEQFWVPYHCNADGDEAPLCSFKRSIGHWTQLNWKETGRIFTENPFLIDLQEKFVNYQGMTLMVQELFSSSDDVQVPSLVGSDCTKTCNVIGGGCNVIGWRPAFVTHPLFPLPQAAALAICCARRPRRGRSSTANRPSPRSGR